MAQVEAEHSDVVRARRAPKIDIVLGDVTRASADVIVGSICPTLASGGAVHRALIRRAGRVVASQLARSRDDRFPGGLPNAGCVATCAGDLAAQWLVHAAGPLWDGTAASIAELSATHLNALRVADELGATSVALSAISVGGCRFPIDTAAATAIAAVRAAETNVERVTFVISNRHVYATYVGAFVGAT